MVANEWLADRFEEHRNRLRAVAYRMLGSVAESDDAVQDAWLRLSRCDANQIENLGGWLTTVVARVCLNMLRSRKTRGEEPFRRARPRPGHQCQREISTRPRGVARRFCWPRAPRRPRCPLPCRAIGIRAPRHVRSAIRGDRPHSRSEPRGRKATREQSPTAGEGRRGARP